MKVCLTCTIVSSLVCYQVFVVIAYQLCTLKITQYDNTSTTHNTSSMVIVDPSSCNSATKLDHS